MDRLQHIAIPVTEIDEAIDWYRDQFKADVVYADDSWALLRFANIDLALTLPDQHPPHIAVEHDNAASFGALTRHRDGIESVYIEDPWGNTVEIMQAVRSH